MHATKTKEKNAPLLFQEKVCETVKKEIVQPTTMLTSPNHPT
jgi:hypothetical protein